MGLLYQPLFYNPSLSALEIFWFSTHFTVSHLVQTLSEKDRYYQRPQCKYLNEKPAKIKAIWNGVNESERLKANKIRTIPCSRIFKISSKSQGWEKGKVGEEMWGEILKNGW